MLRWTTFLALFLSLAASQPAFAYSGCEHYRFGSQEWWFCMSDRNGER